METLGLKKRHISRTMNLGEVLKDYVDEGLYYRAGENVQITPQQMLYSVCVEQKNAW